jgi:hypothetical protein
VQYSPFSSLDPSSREHLMLSVQAFPGQEHDSFLSARPHVGRRMAGGMDGNYNMHVIAVSTLSRTRWLPPHVSVSHGLFGILKWLVADLPCLPQRPQWA